MAGRSTREVLMADNPTDEIAKALAKALDAHSQFVRGNLLVIAGAVTILRR